MGPMRAKETGPEGGGRHISGDRMVHPNEESRRVRYHTRRISHHPHVQVRQDIISDG
jgi:hypothetical protein